MLTIVFASLFQITPIATTNAQRKIARITKYIPSFASFLWIGVLILCFDPDWIAVLILPI